MGLVRLLDLSHSLRIVWRGSGEMVCLTGVGPVSHLLSISVQCCGSMGTGSLICWPNH